MTALLLALIVAAAPTPTPSPPPTAPPDVPPLRRIVPPETVLARYAAALAAVEAPRVISFEYLLEQTGARDLLQTHRVFRSGTDQRDEILAVDGRPLQPPAVRITHGRRDRYAVQALAPKPGAYAFHFVGVLRDGRHDNYVFATTPATPGAFRVVGVTIDGVRYLPASISFDTDAHQGSGTITFGLQEKYWVPALAVAHATYAKLAAQERITFSDYRFPASLPPGTFARPHPAPAVAPDN